MDGDTHNTQSARVLNNTSAYELGRCSSRQVNPCRSEVGSIPTFLTANNGRVYPFRKRDMEHLKIELHGTCPHCRERFAFYSNVRGDNQAKPESGTTPSSAAGGGIEQGKPDHSAGREPWWDELKMLIEKRLTELKIATAETDDPELDACYYELGHTYGMMRSIEARRRSQDD